MGSPVPASQPRGILRRLFAHPDRLAGRLPKPLGARHSLPGSAEGNHDAGSYIGSNRGSTLPSPLPQMAKSIVELIARALISARPQRHEKASLNQSRQWIGKAEELCRQHGDQPRRIGQLCREIGVSERTLRDAFHELTATRPHAYLKTRQT